MLAPDTLPIVRKALPEEKEEIMAMCRELHRENGLFELDEEKVSLCLDKFYRREGAIVGVIGETGKLEASCCLIFSDMYYTNDWHVAELWNHVLPEYRKSHNAEALIEFGKKCSEDIGLPFITGIITNNRTASKVRLYRRRLGYPAGAFFVWGGAWANECAPTMDDFNSTFESSADRRKRKKREQKEHA